MVGVEHQAAQWQQGVGATSSKQGAGGSQCCPGFPSVLTPLFVPTQTVESGVLALLQGLAQQLHSTCQPLVSSLQGLPAGIQDTAAQVRHNVEELRANLTSATSLQELTGSAVTRARAHATKARELMDELVEHVAHNTPLSWLVGPFAPSVQQGQSVQGE